MVGIIKRTLDKSLHMVSSSLDNNLSMLMILCVIRNLMMIKFSIRDISWDRAVCISHVITMTNNPRQSQYRYRHTREPRTGDTKLKPGIRVRTKT